MAGVTAFVAVLRAWKKDLHTLTAVLVALVAMSLILLASGDWFRYLSATDRGWSNVRKRLTTPPDLGPSTRSDPHILHIVLDGMGRSDILQEYGVGQADLADLGASSLRVIPDAVANYPYTYEAFASALNMNYLDELTEALANRPDRRPYLTLVHESAVFRALKHRGYEIWVVGSGFEITAASPLADRCSGCGHGFPNLFESALSSILPIRSLVSWTAFYDAHRRRLSGAFETLDHVDFAAGRAKLVIAHLMAPHPPFVFGITGPIAGPSRPYDILDERLFRGTREEYRRGYSAQATYVLREIRRIVDRARERSRRPLVVIVHGDHGPGLDFDVSSPEPARYPRTLFDSLGSWLARGSTGGDPAVTGEYLPGNLHDIPRSFVAISAGARLCDAAGRAVSVHGDQLANSASSCALGRPH